MEGLFPRSAVKCKQVEFRDGLAAGEEKRVVLFRVSAIRTYVTRGGLDMTEDRKKVLSRLRWFVFRARRVADHSLVIDRDQLLKWAKGRIRCVCVDGVPHSFEWNLPDEEAFESLAGRVRPFLMPRDDLYFAKVLCDLHPHLKGDAELAKALDRLQKRWARFDPKNGQALAYAMQISDATGALRAFVADTTLADAWLYCDFGHGDTNVISRVGPHRLDNRYGAAVLLVSNIAVCTVSALNLMRKAWEAGLLPLDEADFADPVFARTQILRKIDAVAFGPVGTSLKELEEKLDRARAE